MTQSLSSDAELRAAFHVFDIDGNGLIDSEELRLTMSRLGNGLIDSEELRLTMSRLGENVSETDVDAMIRAVDRNNDGKVDYEGLSSTLQLSLSPGWLQEVSRAKR